MKKSMVAISFIVFVFGPVSRASTITIQEGLLFVSKQSRDVLKALQSETGASARVSEAWSYWLPQIQLYAHQTYLKYQPEAKFGLFGPVPMGEKDFITYGFRATQLIYDFGALYSSISAAKAELRAMRFLSTSVRNTMALEFIKRYMDLLEAERLLEVAKHQEQAYREHLRDAKVMYENGLVTKNDLLQAEVAFAQAQQDRINAENLLKIRQASLNLILTRRPDEKIEVQDPSSPANLEMTLQEAYQRALQARPELTVLEARIRAIKLQRSAVKRQFLPKLFLAGGYEYQQNQYMVHEGNWSFMVGLKVNLFSGGIKIAKLRELNSKIRALEIEKDKLKDQILLQVKGAYLNLHSARNRLEVAEKAVAQAEENYRLHRLRYKEGLGTSTDVTDALVMLRAQKTNYYKALYEAKKAEAELLYAIGADLVFSYNSQKEALR